MQLFINGWGLVAGAQRSACLARVNGRLNPGLIRRRSRIPNKHAHSWCVQINSFLSFVLFLNGADNNLVFLFHVQRWTSRVWSSPLVRRTAWTASVTARRRTTTASRAAPATPATQPHIPTDCSRITVRRSGPSSPSLIQLPHPCFPSPTPPTTYIRPVHKGGTPRTCSFYPGSGSPGSTWG